MISISLFGRGCSSSSSLRRSGRPTPITSSAAAARRTRYSASISLLLQQITVVQAGFTVPLY